MSGWFSPDSLETDTERRTASIMWYPADGGEGRRITMTTGDQARRAAGALRFQAKWGVTGLQGELGAFEGYAEGFATDSRMIGVLRESEGRSRRMQGKMRMPDGPFDGPARVIASEQRNGELDVSRMAVIVTPDSDARPDPG